MSWLLDRTFGERLRASRIVQALGLDPTLRLMSILKRTSVFCQSVGGPPGTVKGQTQSVPRFEGDQDEGNRKLIVLQRAHGAIR